MRRIIVALVLLFSVGCNGPIVIDWGGGVLPLTTPTPAPNRPRYQYPAYQVEYPTVNLETVLRQKNWRGRKGEGSCVHATTIMLLRWQGQYQWADYWKATYGDGEWPEGLASKFDAEGIQYAYTSGERNVHFLEWACQTRRGAGVTCMGGIHMVMLVHLDNEWAGIIDNNYPDEVKWYPRETFLQEWYNSNSWAVTPIISCPPPPLPYSK